MSDRDVDDDDDPQVSSFTESRSEGEQRVSVLTGEQELKAQTAAQRHELSRTRLRHQQEEERKRNDLRRHQEQIAFYIVLSVVVAGLVVGSFIATQSQDAGTRTWAQNGVTILIGGIVGGIAGYFTGRAGR